MTPEKLKKIEDIYHAALEVAAVERASFVKQLCGDDEELLFEVNSLLSFDEITDSLMDNPPADLAAEMFSVKESSSLKGKNLAHYKIISLLGAGGMGEVYLALDTKLHRRVALKVLPAEMVENKDRMRRFIGEARAASALNHPNILTIYEVNHAKPQPSESQITNAEQIRETAEVHYIAMEFVDGKTLNELIHGERNDLKTLFGYFSQAADGLAKAHSAGIVHRDLKPDNIMVSNDGFVKILDFGLAKLVDAPTGDSDEFATRLFSQPRSLPGIILGTLGYMSPEQAQGKSDIDQRSDIFSYGCILYEAVTRRKPFTGSSVIDSLHQVIHSEPVPIDKFNISAPAALQQIINKCLEKKPEDRFQTITEAVSELRKLQFTEDENKTISINKEAVTRIDENRTKLNLVRPVSTISEQRRLATILFADLSALTESLEEFDPEEANEILDKLWTKIGSVIAENSGKIDRHLSDSFTAVWGADETREDDPEQTVRTALSLQTELSEHFNQNISGQFEDFEEIDSKKLNFVKAGISTGMILFETSENSGEFSATGAAVNLAKRLSQSAALGDVLISHDTYRYVRGVFDVSMFELERKMSFKRRSEQLKVYRVKRAKPRAFRIGTRGVEGIETKMIGRDGELKRMLDALHTVIEDKELQTVTVVGEAGLGKSRLLYEFREQIELLPDKIRLFNARATQAMRGLSYSLVRDIFSFRFEIQESDSKIVAREKFVNGILELTADSPGNFGTGVEAEAKTHFIGQMIGLDFAASPHLKDVSGDFQQIHDRALLYATQFFSSIAQDFPVLIYLDDLQWADDGSLDFFDQLTKDCADSAILILELARPTLFERRPHWGEGQENRTKLKLQPLTKRESRELVKNILQRVEKVPQNLRDLIVSNAEGNPFYVEELIKMLIEQGAIIARENEWHIDENQLGETIVPPTLTGVLQSRLDQLTLWERTVLQRASVIGREFWENALESFGAESDIQQALESLRRKELLYRRETSAFAGTNEYLFKHALLRDVTYETVLLRERRHLHEKFAEWMIGSSNESKENNAANIAEHFEKARNFKDSAEWFGRAGDYAEKVYAPTASVVYYRKALKFLDSISEIDAEEKQKKIIKWNKNIGEALRLEAKFDESIKLYKRTIEEAEKTNDNLSKAQLLLGLSIVQFEQGDTLSSLESANKSINSARQETSTETALQALAEALFRKARAHHEQGDFEKAIETGKESLAITEQLGKKGAFVRVHSLHIIGMAHLPLGDFENAIFYQNKSLELARESGNKRNISYALNNLGAIYNIRGEFSEALRYFKESLPIMYEIGNRSGQILVHGNYGAVLVELGRFDEAKEHLDKAIELIGDSGYFIFSEIYQNLARCLIGQKLINEAFEAALISLKAAEESGSPEAIGTIWRVLGLIASQLQNNVRINEKEISAADCFEKSLRVFTENKMEVERGRTLESFAKHEFHFGDKDRAQEMRLQANEIFTRLEMKFKVESFD